MNYSQLDCCQELQQVSTIHVVQVEQQVFTVSGQFDRSQLEERAQGHKVETSTGGTRGHGDGSVLKRIITLSRMWMLVKYSDGTWKSKTKQNKTKSQTCY